MSCDRLYASVGDYYFFSCHKRLLTSPSKRGEEKKKPRPRIDTENPGKQKEKTTAIESHAVHLFGNQNNIRNVKGTVESKSDF
jgi:hypothetical protein